MVFTWDGGKKGKGDPSPFKKRTTKIKKDVMAKPKGDERELWGIAALRRASQAGGGRDPMKGGGGERVVSQSKGWREKSRSRTSVAREKKSFCGGKKKGRGEP